MPPAALFTVRTPSATGHVAGDLSFISTHSSRLEPLNSTMASDGGPPLVPGVMIFGTGVQTSVSSGRVGTRAPDAAVVVVAAGAGVLCGAGCCPAQAARPSAPSMESESNDSRECIARIPVGEK